MTQIEERTLALAGILQACSQVQALARTGEVNEAASRASLQSILVLDAISTNAVFGGTAGVTAGLLLLKNGVLSSPQAADVELNRYAMSLMHLQSRLYRDQAKFEEFGRAVEQLSAWSGDELVRACSDVYQQFVSSIQPQIIVQGEEGFLQREDVPPQVRALLLAGLRAAVLWRQVGGNMFRLRWERAKYRAMAALML